MARRAIIFCLVANLTQLKNVTTIRILRAAERTFPVRVWKSGGAVVAHDGLNVDNYATNGGKIAFDVRGEAMALGEGFILGTIGAESPLPALARPWVAKRRDGGLLHVSISSGLSIIVR